MSGWKRENCVFMQVLARFRGLEGVRILTISGIFLSQVAFQEAPGRHLFEIFEVSGSIWAPPGRQFCDIFSDFLSMSKKA